MTERNDPAPLAPQCVICARHRCEDPQAAHSHAPDRRCTDACPCTEAGCQRRDAVVGLLVCRRCYRRMEDHLRDIPELYALALGEMHPGQGEGGRSSETSLGVRVSALDLRSGGDVLERLATWERDWREHFDIDPVASGGYRTVVVGRAHDGRPVRAGSTYNRSQALDRYARGRKDAVAASIVGVVGFLLGELHRAAGAHYAIDDFARDLGAIHAQVVAAARTGAAVGWSVDCPNDGPDGICGRRLRVTSANFDSGPGEHDAEPVVCDRCHRQWDAKWLLQVGAADADAEVWAPAEDVALLYGVSARTLQRWAKAGGIERVNGLYSVASVREAIESDKRRDGASA